MQADAPKRATIITVFNEKGGSGKTTLSCQLANTLGMRGHSVLLADLDAQQTSKAWSASGQPGAFKAVVWKGDEYAANVAAEINKLSDKFDFIIADCAPSVDQPATWGMLLISHLALIPTRLSPPDLKALKVAKKLVREAFDELEQTFPVRVVPNCLRPQRKGEWLGEEAEYLELLAQDKDIPPLDAVMVDRRAYQRSMLEGSSVHAVEKADSGAVAEIEHLTDRVLAAVGRSIRKSTRKAVNA